LGAKRKPTLQTKKAVAVRLEHIFDAEQQGYDISSYIDELKRRLWVHSERISELNEEIEKLRQIQVSPN
jgi:hypothetical protein